MNMIGASEALSRSKIRLRQYSPFFAVLTLFATYRFDESVEVAETDGREVRLNETVFLELDDAHRIGLLLHVTMHAALQHPSRMRGRNVRTWNIACDVMVNYILRTQTPFPPPPGTIEAADLDRKLVPETAEQVYEWLQRKHQKVEKLASRYGDLVGASNATSGAKSKSNDGLAESNADDPDRDSNSARAAAASGANLRHDLRNSSMASAFTKRFGTKTSNKDLTARPESASNQDASTERSRRTKPFIDLKPRPDKTTQELLQQHWNAALISAQQHRESRQRGVDPGKWLLELQAASEPEIEWRTLLSRFMIQTPTDFGGFDHRFIHSGLYIETLEQQTLSIVVAVDTSGSISGDELNKIAAELLAIVGVYPHIECSLYFCDVDAHGPFPLDGSQPLPAAVGGGGTDFRPFFSLVENMRHTRMTKLPSALIYFTDGFGVFPDSPPEYPTMWIALPGAAPSKDFPFGSVIRMNAP